MHVSVDCHDFVAYSGDRLKMQLLPSFSGTFSFQTTPVFRRPSLLVTFRLQREDPPLTP
jgi:hypothetical protein